MRFNTQTKITGLLLCLVSVLTLGCKRDTSDQSKIIDIKKEFSVQPWEILKESGSEFGFVISSIEKKCDGTKMRIVPNILQNGFTVNLQSFITPDTCFNSSDVVRDTVRISQFANGNYTLQINLKDVIINSGTLTVSDTKFGVQMLSSDGISVPTPELLRVPQGTIWGTVSYNSSQESAVSAFTDSLKTYAHNFSLVNGNYGYFQFTDNNFVPNAKTINPTFTNQRTYFMRLDKPLANLNNLMQKTKTQLGKNGSVNIMAYNGYTF